MSDLELEVQQLEGPGSSPRRQVSAIVIGCGNRGQTYSRQIIFLHFLNGSEFLIYT
jgi:hypothetical protein